MGHICRFPYRTQKQQETELTRCRWAAATICLRSCKLTISSNLFARWHLFRHVGYLRHQQQVDLWPFDLETGVWVTCDVSYLCANFSLPRPLCSRVRPDVRDRQTSDRQTSDVRQKHRLMPPPYRDGGITTKPQWLTINLPSPAQFPFSILWLFCLSVECCCCIKTVVHIAIISSPSRAAVILVSEPNQLYIQGETSQLGRGGNFCLSTEYALYVVYEMAH